MDHDGQFLIAPLDGAHRRIAPTDVSGFLRTDQCWRFMRLRLYERAAGRKAFDQFGTPLQPAPQMLTRSGDAFERDVYSDIDRVHQRIDFGKVAGGGGRRKPDNSQVASIASDLLPGQSTVLSQPRLEATLGAWIVTGDLDLVRFDRESNGILRALIVDIKKSSSATVEHKLQVAFYQEMLGQVLAERSVSVDRIELAILFEGPKHSLEDSAIDREAALRDAEATLGTTRGLLERVDNPLDFVEGVRDLVTGTGSVANKIVESDFADLPFHLAYVCDSCQYNPYCLKWCADNDDLSLIPHLSQTEKTALKRSGVETTTELANLKLLVKDGSVARLATPPEREEEVRRLSTTWGVGANLDEFIHRARQYRRRQKDDIEALSYIPESGYGSLPYCDSSQNPNLIRIYLDAQHDYLTDRIYLLGSLVSAAEGGIESPGRHRSVVRLTPNSPDDSSEAAMFENWIIDTLKAIAEVAVPDENGEPNAPIHLIFFDELTQRRFLEGLGRHATAILSATPLYDFVTQMAAFDSSLISFLDAEIAAQKNYPILCQSLMSVSGYRGFDWKTPLHFRNLFRRNCFDSQMRLESDDPGDGSDGVFYTGRARFSSLIPLEYAYAAWRELDKEYKAEDYAEITPEVLIAFEQRRLEAMEFIAKDLKENRDTTKTQFHLPDLDSFVSTARSLAHAIDEFVVIERHVEVAEWKRERLAAPEKRVLAGQTLVVRYEESDQAPGVAAQLKENARRRELHQQMKAKFDAENPGKRFTRSKEQQEATFASQEGLIVRLRFDTTDWERGLEEAISIANFSKGDRIVLRERWTVDSRLPVEQQKQLTPTPKQLLYGERATFQKFSVQRDANGVVVAGFAEIELLESRDFGKSGFIFKGHPCSLEQGKVYTIDPDPNNVIGSWQKEIAEGLIDGGANALYERLTGARTDLIDWPALSKEAQEKFMAGLRELASMVHFPNFEASKEAFLVDHGPTPILLVQGPPGTGKSYTTGFVVFALIQGAMAAGNAQRILVSCKTHAATDVLLEDIRQAKFFLQRIHLKHGTLFRKYFDERLLDVPLFRFQPRGDTADGVIPLRRKYQRPKEAPRPLDLINGQSWAICAGTPGGVYGQVKDLAGTKSLFGFEIFDTIVFDEASQMGLPEAIMAALPLKLDGRIIVVGDPRQMPPIIKHDWEHEARRSFKEFKSYRSLFETLLELEPRPPMIQFQESFRLHKEMAEFLRREIYEQDGIAYHSAKEDFLELPATGDPFVDAVLDPNHPIIVIAHDEARSQVANEFEQSLICALGDVLSAQPKEQFDSIEHVGIVVPHRKQRTALQQALPKLSQIDQSTDEPRGSAIDTVERFQGGERTLILISATESDPQFLLSTSEFILDPRRLTVALSRAKRKLILVASESIFQIFSSDEEVFANAQVWKNLLRRTCTKLLWEGERDGHWVRVWGNVAATTNEVLATIPASSN
jgi:AAA domain/PD-(D/E)XK nuclease superfamily